MANAKIIEVDETEETVACPRCGVTIIDEDGFGEEPPCQHVMFIYNSQFGFGCIAPSLQGELDAAQKLAYEAGTALDVQTFLQGEIGDDGVILERTEHGLACAPITFTIWVGIRSSKEG